MKTLQDCKKAIMNHQYWMSKAAKTHDEIYQQIADAKWAESGMHALDIIIMEPANLPEQIVYDFNHSKMYHEISEKQAFLGALAICKKNNIDTEVVNKYWCNKKTK